MKNFYKNILLFGVWVLMSFNLGFGQTEIFNEAGGGAAPAGWAFDNNVTSNDIDRGSYWLVEDGTTNDFITTATYDLSSYTSAEFTLDVATFGSGTDNPAKIEFSFNGGSSYTQTEVSNTPISSSYINGGTFTLNSLTNQVVIRISTNGTTGRDVRLRNLVLTASGTSGGSCSLTNSGLANVTCNDNATTSDTSDDFITFDLNPTGSNLGASFNVTVSSGSVTPTSGTYGSATTFTLNNGSAGGGNVDVTITDVDDATCTSTETIIDPGSCSSGGGGTSSCGVDIDFETSGGYTTSISEDIDETTDYFGRIEYGVDTPTPTFTNLDGSFYFGAQDIDGVTSNPGLPVELNMTNIDISSLTNLEFSIDLAEDDGSTNGNWDDNDYVRIYYTIDSGTEQNLLWIENDGSSFNSHPFIDTDFNGTGDGTEITDSFTTFTESFSSTGSSMNIRIEFNLDSGDEDIAIDNIKVCGTPASSNDNNSDIIATNFDPTDNIDYLLYDAISGLTTTNAIKVGEFEIRDGGATAPDADGVGTILTDLDLEITNFENLEAIALFDGAINVSEITAPSSTTSFTSINSGVGITAGDNGTKTFGVYVTFSSTVTDNQQLELSISNATADSVNGSVFSEIDAGGASTPTALDDNRIEVTATDLIFDQNPSDVELSTTMSPSPTVIAVDANVNTDTDFTASVSLSVNTTNFDSTATTDQNAVAGVATFSNLIFDSTSTGSILTSSSGTLNNDTSVTFEVFTAPMIIALQDFDNSSPSWSYSTNIPFFGLTSNFGDDFFGIIDISNASPLNNSNFADNIIGENDLNSPNGTSGFAVTAFDEISIENFSNITLSFDWQVVGYNATDDDAKYEIIVDGSSQGETFLVDGGIDPQNGSGTVNFSVPPNSSTLSIIISIRNDGGSGYSGFDNFKIVGNYDGDLIYSGGTWSPNTPPSTTTGVLDALIQDGTYTTSGDISLNSISVLGDASVEISSSDVLTIVSSINNNGTFSFKSDDSGSGQLADATGVTITRNVNVERYIPAGTNTKRAFRFLTSAVNSTGSINANWQEGVNNTGTNFPVDNQNPNPGFGTHITGGTSSNGFDQSGTNNPSMFTFNNDFVATGAQTQTDAWTALPNTNSKTLQAGEPYLTFVRGDRSIDVTSNSATPTNTTLRATGSLHTGSLTFDVGNPTDYLSLSGEDDYYSLIGNPYQAIVDFSAVTRSGLTDFIYVWDASVSDAGSYVTVDITGSTTPPNPFSSDASEFIAPGQSFFVQNDNAPGDSSITFEEADKATGATEVTVFETYPHFYINSRLYKTSDFQMGNSESDALGLRFSDNYTALGNNNEDATKLDNPGENYAVINNGLRSIDYQEIPTLGHEVDFSITNYTETNYSLTFVMENKPGGLGVFLRDKYLNTQTELTESFVYDFTVDTNIPGSNAENRFSLIFDNTTLGIDDNNFGANFSLYPNPTSNGLFSIQTPNLSGEVSVEISNLLGQQVSIQELTVIGQQVDINAQNLSTGLYVVKLSQGNQSFSSKLIVE